MNEKFNELKLNWVNFQKNNPKIRIRDAAKSMGVSEADLLSTELGNDVNYLKIDNISKFIAEILKIDQIMMLTRNESVVHELTVNPLEINFVGNCLTDKHQLPLLEFNHTILKHVFYQKKIHAGKELRSFQIFSKNGKSCIKFFLKGPNEHEFDELGNRYNAKYNYTLLNEIRHSRLDSLISKNGLPNDFNYSSSNDLILKQKAVAIILKKCAKHQHPVEIEVFGIGVRQYFRGQIKKVVNFGLWENILDKEFNLHVLSNEIDKVLAKEIKTPERRSYIFDFFDKKAILLMRISILKYSGKKFEIMMNEIKEKCNVE